MDHLSKTGKSLNFQSTFKSADLNFSEDTEEPQFKPKAFADIVHERNESDDDLNERDEDDDVVDFNLTRKSKEALPSVQSRTSPQSSTGSAKTLRKAFE